MWPVKAGKQACRQDKGSPQWPQLAGPKDMIRNGGERGQKPDPDK